MPLLILSRKFQSSAGMLFGAKPATLMTVMAVWMTAILDAGDALPRSKPEAEGFDPSRLERVVQLVENSVKTGEYAGAIFLVARHGRIVLQGNFGSRDLKSGAPMDNDTICRIYSMTKVVTSVAVLQLLEQNKLNLDSPVERWLPELRNLKVFVGGTADLPQLEPAKKRITVKMLLNHTAGFTYDIYAVSPVHELYKRQDLWLSPSLDVFIRKVAQLPLLSQPGVAFNYSVGDDILGLLIQRVSGESFEDYISRHITGPLKMVDTAFDVPEEKRNRLAKIHEAYGNGMRTTLEIMGAFAEPGRGFSSGGSGLFSTAGDFARFAQCLLGGGKLEGVRILGRKTLELARLNSLPAGVHAFSASEGWGLMSAVRLDVAQSNEPGSAGMFYWSGAATTHFFCDPDEQVLGVVLCQQIPIDQHGLFKRFRIAIYQALE